MALPSRISLSLFAIALCSLTGCGSADSHANAGDFSDAPYVEALSEGRTLILELRTSPEQPPLRGVNNVEFTALTPRGETVSDLALRVTPWMPAMGHGASSEPSVRALGDGKYLAEDVRLFMAGEWQLHVAISGTVNDSAIASFEVR